MPGFFLVGAFETGKDFAQVGDGFVKQTGQCLTVLDDDFRPHGGIPGRHAGGVAEPAAAEFSFGRILQADARGTGRHEVGQVADAGDQFIMDRGGHP